VRGNIVSLLGVLETMHVEGAGGRAHDERACWPYRPIARRSRRTIYGQKEPVMRSKQWRDLTAAQKRGIMLLGALQLALLITALIDIRRRPADAINGSKRLWTAVVFINGIGPIAYFVVGRKRPAPARVTI
jgi:hypothetical protein